MVEEAPNRRARDPSALTTDMVHREIAMLREMLESRLRLEEVAGNKRREALDRIPGETEKLISHLGNLQLEKFSSVAQQFVERDVRSEQANAASAQALAAALQAAKELVGAQGEASAAAAVKSETSFTKQIDQIGTIIQTLEKALDARITELKERIDRGEGSTQGVRENQGDSRAHRSENRSDLSAIIAVVSVLLLLVSVAFTLSK